MFKALDDSDDGDVADISDDDSGADEDDTFKPVRASRGHSGGRRRCLQVRAASHMGGSSVLMPLFK